MNLFQKETPQNLVRRLYLQRVQAFPPKRQSKAGDRKAWSLIYARECRVNSRKKSMCTSVMRKMSNVSSKPANLLPGLMEHIPLLTFRLTFLCSKDQPRNPLTNKESKQKVLLQIKKERVCKHTIPKRERES